MKPTWIRASTGLDVKTAMSASGRFSSFRTCTRKPARVCSRVEARLLYQARHDSRQGHGRRDSKHLLIAIA